MPAAFRIKFTETNSAAATTAPVLTVPAGTIASDVIFFCANFITGTNLTATVSTSGAGTATQILGGVGFAESTSAQGFLYRGTGFVAGDTITVTPSTLNRSVTAGVVYSSCTYETAGTAGTTSTTVSTANGITTAVDNDIAVACNIAVSGATGNTFSSHTAGWNQRTFIQGGSGTRFQMIEFSDKVISPAGATSNFVATSAAAMLGSTGAQAAVAGIPTSLVFNERLVRRNSLLRR